MADPGVVAALIGYGVTVALNKVLQMVKQIMAFPKEYLRLQSRLLRLQPMVDAMAAMEAAHPNPATPQPSADQPVLDQTAVKEWLNQVKELLGHAEQLLEDHSNVRRGRFDDFRKKQQFVAKLTLLTLRIDEVLQDSALAALVKMDSMLAKLLQMEDELCNRMEALAEKYQESSSDNTSEIRRMQEEHTKLLQELNKRIDDGFSHQLALLQDQQRHSRAAAEDPLASTLKAVFGRTRYDKRCKVKLDILELTDIPPYRFRPPREIEPYEPERAQPSDHRGSAVEGGYVVQNDTKVELTIEVTTSSAWFFYILHLDHTTPGSSPQLHFPTTVGQEDDYNSVSKMIGKRVFPRRRHYDDDPLSLDLVRSHISPADAYDRVSLYVVFASTCLTPGRTPTESITIEDVADALNSFLAQDPDSKNVIVKHFQFDIKPPQAQVTNA